MHLGSIKTFPGRICLQVSTMGGVPGPVLIPNGDPSTGGRPETIAKLSKVQCKGFQNLQEKLTS